MEPNKKKRGRPRKAVAAPKKLTQCSPLYFALAKCADIVERRFRKLEALQVSSGGNAEMISKIWN